MKPLNRSFYVSAAIAIGLNYVFITQFIGDSMVSYAMFGTTVIGVILVPVIQKITDNYTSYKKDLLKKLQTLQNGVMHH